MTQATFAAELRVLGPGPGGAMDWLERLPGLLDHADGLIAAGTIGGEQPNAADLQVGASVALLMKLEDLRGQIEQRPVGQLADRLFSFPGTVPSGALPVMTV